MNSFPAPVAVELTHGHVLARSTIWNLAGQILPMLAAVCAIPAIVKGIGLDRFGILTLGWVVVGYFSLFDLGLGRALTKMVADKLAMGRDHELHALIWTSSFLMLALGLIAGIAMFALSPWLVDRVLKVPNNLKLETLHALYLLSASVPIVISTSGFRGVLEAMQRFGTVNRIRIPMAISVFLGPLLIIPFTKSLAWIFAFLVAGRFFAWIAYIVACMSTLPGLERDITIETSNLKAILQFGGWITAGNLIAPILVYVDRFVIGALLSLTAVAYYTTPFEAVSKLLTLPGAMAGVLFPAFATSYVRDKFRTGFLMQRAVKYVFLALFPIVLILVAFAPEGLKLWVGAVFAQNSTVVLRYLAAGVFVNCLAQIPLSLVQGTGRPDLAAKLQAVELPLYLAAIYWATKNHGLAGAAIAWSSRVTVDALILFVLAYRLLPHRQSQGVLFRLAASVVAALAIFYCVTLPPSLAARAVMVTAVLLILAAAAWFAILVEDERATLRGMMVWRSKAAA
jgi:O-antigen/teichoic acid export membrane protein